MQEFNQLLLKILTKPSNHAVVKHADNLVRQNKNIPRVRVCMEKTVIEHLLEESISTASGYFLKVIALRLKLLLI